MTQRIFDIDNERDMADLWDILPEMVKSIEKDETEEENAYNRYMATDYYLGSCPYIKINWHNKTEIYRPIKEAKEADIGKICMFWNKEIYKSIDILRGIDSDGGFVDDHSLSWQHCRRLTKQEIEELC